MLELFGTSIFSVQDIWCLGWLFTSCFAGSLGGYAHVTWWLPKQYCWALIRRSERSVIINFRKANASSNSNPERGSFYRGHSNHNLFIEQARGWWKYNLIFSIAWRTLVTPLSLVWILSFRFSVSLDSASSSNARNFFNLLEMRRQE